MTGNRNSGRKMKPTALKLVTGNPGGRPLNMDEPKPPPDMPKPPKFLDAYARQEWKAQAQALYDMGVLTSVDGGALGAYCMAFSLWRRAEERLQADAKVNDKLLAGGILIETKQGNVIQNPLQGVANTARRDMVKLAAEFGLTPSSRANLQGGRKPDDDPVDRKFF